MSGYTRARSAKPAGPRANKFAAPCAGCGQEVPAGAGLLTGGQRSGWKVEHKPRRWVGVPCGGDMIGKPGMGRWVGGCPDAKAGTDAAEVAAVAELVLCETGSHPVEPHAREDSCEHPDSELPVYRQRCEDAPCCGHARCAA
jgi:hypothetical protein